jgi:amino acid transporter
MTVTSIRHGEDHTRQASNDSYPPQVSPELSADLSNSGAPVEERSPLGYHVGLTSAIALNLTSMIGMGIYTTPSSVLSSVELSSIIGPLRSGAEVAYLEQAYPRPPLLFPMTYGIVSVVLSGSGINAIVFAEHALDTFELEITPWRQRTLAVAMVTFSMSFCLISTKRSLQIMNIATAVRIAMLCFMSLTGLIVLSGLTKVKDPYANFRHPFEGSKFNGNGLATAMAKVTYCFSGWSNALNIMAEVKGRDPIRTVRNAGYISVAIVSFLFLTTVASYMVVLTKDQIKDSGELVGALFVKEVFGYRIGGKVFSIFVAIVTIGGTIGSTVSQTRLLREVGRQGVLPYPAFWSSVRPFGTPLGPICLKYFLSLCIIILPPAGDAFNFLLDLSSYPHLIFGIAVSTAVWKLRRKQQKLGLPPSPYQVMDFVVWIYLVRSVFLVVLPWVPPEGGSNKGDVSFFYAMYCIVAFGLLAGCGAYYYVRIILLPRWGGYEIAEETITLSDGALTKRLVKVYGTKVVEHSNEESAPLLSESAD